MTSTEAIHIFFKNNERNIIYLQRIFLFGSFLKANELNIERQLKNTSLVDHVPTYSIKSNFISIRSWSEAYRSE